MSFADLGIHLYTAESATLRTLKAVKKKGLEKAFLKAELTNALIDESLLDVEMTAK